MQGVRSFFKLIRFNNLVILFATLVFAKYCSNASTPFTAIFDFKFIYLIIACMLTAAAGYIINDYYDVKLDMVNKPKKVVVGNIIPRRWAMLLHICFSMLAIVFGVLINTKVAILILLCTIILWLYSISFKKQFLIGNIIVAMMSAFVIFILKIYDHQLPTFFILVYSAFAFFISILREIIKDIEDIKGDKNFGCKTLPIVLGVIKTKKVLIGMNLCFILFIFYILFFSDSLSSSQSKEMYFYYTIYLSILVIIPLIVMIYQIKFARIKKDFSRLSLTAKIIMVFGILSMLFFRY